MKKNYAIFGNFSQPHGSCEAVLAVFSTQKKAEKFLNIFNEKFRNCANFFGCKIVKTPHFTSEDKIK